MSRTLWSTLLVPRAARSIALRQVWGWARRVPGLGQVLHRVVRRVVPPGRHFWVQPTDGPVRGLWMLCDPRYELRYLRGDHEPWLGELLQAWLRPGDSFFDVGAHIGYFTLLAARLVGRGGVVVAFEPDASNYQRLVANLLRNDISDQVRAICAAVSVEPGETLFRPASAASSRVGGELVEEGGHVGHYGSVSVRTTNLDRWASYGPRVIKVDVEGAEVEVLRGSSSILASREAYWIVEIHGPHQGAEVKRVLEGHGYAVESLAPQLRTYPEQRQRYVVGRPG